MNSKTRQTLIGVTGLTIVFLMALDEGYNGRVTATYALAVVAIIAPEALEALPILDGGDE